MRLWEVWVFVSPDADDRQRELVAEAATDEFTFPNLISLDRREVRLF